MKKKILTFINTVMLAGLLLLSGCSESEGPTGPAGPVGPAGPQGAAGPQWEPGKANVIYSEWIGASFAPASGGYLGTIDAPPLTQEILAHGDIRVYWSEGGRVISLPYAQTIGDITYTVHQRFYVGHIDLLSSYQLMPSQFRYVIIPGGVAAGRQATIDLDDYEQVKQYYHLPD